MLIVRKKNGDQLITQNDSFGKNWGVKNLGKFLQILQNVIEKSFINWRVLPLVKINTRISDTPCIFFLILRNNKRTIDTYIELCRIVPQKIEILPLKQNGYGS
jgi:hypothetical protein